MNQERLFQLLHCAHVSEKSAMLNQQNNQYVFRVACDARRAEVKEAVEAMFNVNVVKVTLTNVKGKPVANRQSPGRRKHWKKATVRLQAGQQLDVLQSAG